MLPGSQIQGEPGTVFSIKRDKTFILSEGRVLLGAGPSGVDVQVGSSDRHVKLSGETIAIIDAREKGDVRVTVLAGEGDKAAVLSAGGERIATLMQGQEAVIVDNRNQEEFIPIDGVERRPIGAAMTRMGFTMKKASVSINELVRKELLLSCCFGEPDASSHITCKESWVSKQLKQLYGEQAKPSTSQNLVPGADKSSKPTTELLPRVYVQAAVPQGLRMGQDTEVIGVGTDHYRLVKGSVLVAPQKATTIDTNCGTIVSKPGSAALIFVDGVVTRVLNLHDLADGDVRLMLDQQSYRLLPGREVGVVTGAERASAARLVHKDQLGRRRVRILQVNGDTEIVTNDFSVVDALERFPLVAELGKSKESNDRHLYSNIMKMAAVLSLTTDLTRGSYNHGVKQ